MTVYFLQSLTICIIDFKKIAIFWNSTLLISFRKIRHLIKRKQAIINQFEDLSHPSITNLRSDNDINCFYTQQILDKLAKISIQINREIVDIQIKNEVKSFENDKKSLIDSKLTEIETKRSNINWRINVMDINTTCGNLLRDIFSMI